MKNIAVLVLAAGKSSRMKSIKQLEKINQKTLLDITLEKIKNIFSDDIFCVLGANADKVKSEIVTKNINFINNTNFETGLSASIVAGIHHFKKNNLNFESFFILLADQPAIDIAYLKSMIFLSEENKENIIASKYGNKFGVPAIIPKKYFNDLILIEADKGAKEFINHHKNDVLCSDLSTNLLDIDTKEDLNSYKKSISK
ncbi:nucleotidyltransferase family protein [Polaribacter sp. Hel_I_88]|uniref:nucleotidyltransferase family protein n=1 Tax=Polaribacter sp. Hel_I_88 TaxID=1250006 RepID=UPI00047A346F|nr:nucleotidyltransferase family protein [Polaribacter sp. Hel_I_88]